MNVVALIQARMTSRRLPNKVLLPIEGKTVLEHIYERLKYCKNLNEIVVATSISSSDQLIVNLCKKNKIKYFRGNLEDVLDRYYKASIEYKADAVVRITGDCPMIDPTIVDDVIKNYLKKDYDLFSLKGSFPDGLDCQVFSHSALERSWKEAILLSDREHVGTYIEKTSPVSFKIGGIEKFKNLSHFRWTLDEPRDYIFVKEVFRRLYKKKKIFLYDEILQLLEKEPALMQINKGIVRNQGYINSLKRDII